MKKDKEYYKSIAPNEFPMRQGGKWVHNWFSNMVLDIVIIDDKQWVSVENYYQAMKTTDVDAQYPFIVKYDPSEAKRYGRKLELRPDWEEVKEDFMLKALRVKFAPTGIWYERLIATGDDVIVEWNNWGDKYWGVDIRTFEGKNRLGELLMQVRSELMEEIY